MENVLILVVVGLVVSLAIGYIRKSRRKGTVCIGCPNGCGCSGGCGNCPGCH